MTPSRFCDLPEERLLASETRAVLARAINELPERQQQVVRLRDVAGCDAEEVCAVLGLSAGNQRVLLHRARAHLRSVLELFTHQRLVVERHLAFCGPCVDYLDQLRAVIRTTGEVKP